MPTKVSVCIITFNEAVDLPDCLASVAFADEVVVVDSGSTDGTQDLARQAGATVFERKFDDFARQKNYAIDQSHHPWVLILDADERVTPALAQEIRHVIAEHAQVGYMIPFRHYFMDRWIRHGGQYPSYHLRLVQRSAAHYHGAVHEVFNIAESQTGHLSQPIDHYSYKTISELRRKLGQYSSAEAKQVQRRMIDVIYRPIGYFAKHYLWERGFLDGWPGLVWFGSFSYYQFLVARKAVWS